MHYAYLAFGGHSPCNRVDGQGVVSNCGRSDVGVCVQGDYMHDHTRGPKYVHIYIGVKDKATIAGGGHLERARDSD